MNMQKHNYLDSHSTNSWRQGNHSKTIPLLFLCMLTLAATAYAAHDTTVTISPNQARCGDLPLEYTVTVYNKNTSTDSIREVRIYDDVNPVDGVRDAGIVDFHCGNPPTGWTLDDRLALYHYCQYETSIADVYMIDPAESQDFKFEAQLDKGSLEACGNEFKIASIDDVEPVGQVVFKKPKIDVDCSDPVVVKTVGDPKIAGDGFDWWITQSTNIYVNAQDNASQNECDLGLDYCQYKYTVDGGADADFAAECAAFDGVYNDPWCIFINGGTLDFDFHFNEDSVHDITIECYDVVGNKTTVIETDKVDDTPPVSTKYFDGPQKIVEGVEWIDGVTTVEISSVDGGSICHIDGVETYYVNILAEAFVDQYKLDCDPELPCRNSGYCQSLLGYAGYIPPGWWQLYKGAFPKAEESCHVLFYYSEDEIGNKEDVKVNCFFVDKTPPIVMKDNGKAIPDSGESEFTNQGNPNGNFHWITTSMPITFTCDDSKDVTGAPVPHPSGDEELCYKVSYDYPQWEYSTDQYCSAGGGTMNAEGYCCVPATPQAPFVFKFQEESKHNLEYYCEDAVEKKSDVHIQYYKVDDTPPVIDKLVGQPQVGTCPPPQGFDETGGDCYIRDHVTPITFESYDGEGLGCAIDDITCEWKYRVNGGEWGQTYTFKYKDGPFYSVEQPGTGSYPTGNWAHGEIYKEYLSEYVKWTFTITDPSDHYGVGLVINGDSDADPEFQVYFAEWGDKKWHYQDYGLDQGGAYCGWETGTDVVCPSGVCTNGISATGNENGNSFTITIPKALLGGTGLNFGWASQVRTTLLGVYPDWTPWCGFKWETEMVSPGIIFPEDSTHDLEIKCWDALGNTAYDRETFKVDSIPPVTTKAYGDPHYPANINDSAAYPHWITSATPITLTAKDAKVGVDKTYYRNFVVDNVYCQTEHSGCSTAQVQEGGWIEYLNPFTEAEDSCHLIEFYSVDLLGNEETINRQCVFVDNTAPELGKTVGDNNVACETGNPLGCDYYITKQTPVTLTCTDQQPHPVDHVSFQYRYRTSDDCSDWGEWGQWIDPVGEEKIIFFPEDSCHKLEYYCEDALGNKTAQYTEIDVVDTEPPVITKNIVGPKSGQCPPAPGSADICYIDGSTTIEVTAIDPTPHPVDQVTCTWSYTLDGETTPYGPYATFPINFPEETKHNLTIECKDALGNMATDNETFYVDKTPPVTTKAYNGPQYPLDGSYPKWINSSTAISLTVEDAGPHKSGIKETKYRVTMVNDGYCDADTQLEPCSEATGTGEFVDYSTGTSFNISEQSCHLIEYYSVDNVNKTETVKKQCVYVDNNAPTPDKTVGEPKTEWHPTLEEITTEKYEYLADACWSTDPAIAIDCWKVTLQTPIKLDCVDPEPHPVDHEKVCYRVEVDGDDRTEQYCGNTTLEEDGYCCLDSTTDQFYFTEETEHNLSYYCVDALGNKGPIDDEKFKVEGRKFKIQLNKKWNLISVPYSLINPNIEEVLKDVKGDIKAVWTYDPLNELCPTEWCVYHPNDPLATSNLGTMDQGWGYWVSAYDSNMLVIGGSKFKPGPAGQASRNLVKGWNLVGYYGADDGDDPPTYTFLYDGPNGNGKMAHCALYSLGSTVLDKGWTALLTYWEPDKDRWKELDKTDNMDPGAGYWVSTPENYMYTATTSCGFLMDTIGP